MPSVTIYTTRTCSYCRQAKALLTEKGVAYEEVDVGGDPALRRHMRERAGGGHTVPQIFIGATHVGGCDELHDLEAEGRLDPLLAAP